MSMVVYGNLLFSAHFGQAGDKGKIPEVRQEIHCLLFGLLKGSRIGVKCQAGVTMPCKFLDNLSGCLAVRKVKNITQAEQISSLVPYVVTVSVR